MLKVQCKSCASVVEVPIPEPKTVEKIVKEPCKCGLTDETRIHRSWATAAGFAAIVGLIAAFGGCHTINMSEVEKIRAETERRKAENASNQKDMEKMTVELKKYKDFFEEFRKSGPAHPSEK